LPSPTEECREVSDRPCIFFAPADDARRRAAQRRNRVLREFRYLVEAFDAIPDGLVLLDEERHIVFANTAFCSFLGVADFSPLLGSRPGDALGCVRAAEGSCGSTEYCPVCGAMDAILASQGGEAEIRECRILRGGAAGALDLRVRAAPFWLQGEEFTLFVIQDIAHEKRRAALERIFFHDVLNTAGNIRNLAVLLRSAGREEFPRYRDLLDRLSEELTSQIQAQRDLIAAEAGDLPVRPERFDPADVVRRVAALYANDAPVALELPESGATMVSDRTLLQRVLGNMVKNAVEAAEEGETIRLGARVGAQEVSFWVRNRAVLAPSVRLQVFQRSFSTKGTGRGLGTYSMRLLSERYLHGSVSFTSSEGEGTIFQGTYPLVLPAAGEEAQPEVFPRR
jgi:signal transduction histidine kinase